VDFKLEFHSFFKESSESVNLDRDELFKRRPTEKVEAYPLMSRNVLFKALSQEDWLSEGIRVHTSIPKDIYDGDMKPFQDFIT